MTISLVKQLEVHNTLGEGVIWDHHNDLVWWTDILNSKMYSWHFESGLSIYNTPEPLCSFGLTNEPGRFICAFSTGFAYFSPYSDETKWLCKVEEHYPDTRLNDGKVDRQGRFWAGSMRMSGDGPQGSLYCLDKHISGVRVSAMLKDIQISNSLCWSPDSNFMYFADSPTRQIKRYAFNPTKGSIEEETVFATTSRDCVPDGSCVDSEGYLWNAQWGAGKVVRYDTHGDEVMSLDIPCKQPTCVAFGGPELKHLFVTSATEGLDQQDIKTQLANGSMFVYATPYKGLPEPMLAHQKAVDNDNN